MAQNSFMQPSWVELCEDCKSSSSADGNVSEEEQCKNIDSNKIIQKSQIEVQKEFNDSFQDENTPNKVSKQTVTKEIKTDTKIKIEKEENRNEKSPWQFSYASILTNSANKGNIDILQSTPTKLIEKVDVGLKEPNEEKATLKSVKREIQREFLQEDLSLSSHLDVFHMQSPLKLESLDEAMSSPLKGGREMRSAKKRLCQPKLSPSEDSLMPDDVLMPSPKKVTRLTARRKREPGESPLICKRSRRTSGAHNTPKCVVPVDTPPVEIETDEQVLIRRQKQIDYGKNTVGYERYCQMVPKEKRHRKHPQTPPRQIKYSRRAWDGLIKQWRQQLHFWDPPSEGGGNIDDLDISYMSETSSDTASQASSLPATPRDIRRHSSRITRSSVSECSSVADDQDCSPLKDN